ncbi:MAG TPA: cupin domain-containing protein [Thermohalobaculum sp.]|nr:cupin domain-containing protein [Thermohalobaculum sp.]
MMKLVFHVSKGTTLSFLLMKERHDMLSETLTNGLAEYRIGPKIRGYRKRKKLGLAELSAHTGLSTGLLSKIERGQIFPTLPTLLRIAMVFGVGLDSFFSDDDTPAVAVARGKDRIKLPDRPGSPSPAFLFESLNFALNDRPFEAYLAEWPPGRTPAEAHSHEGSELLYLLDGALTVVIEGEDHDLAQGDAICFDSSATHMYRNTDRRLARALVVVTGSAARPAA